MIGCYIRVSTLQQKDNYSVETQRERAIAFASRQSDSYELYDEAKSGKNLERPEFIRLLKDVEDKKLKKIWVIEASRLTRDVEDAQAIKRIFTKNKVELYVNDQHVDLSTSESILTYNITSAVSEYERSKIIDRVIRSRHKQIDDGEQAFCCLLGYDYTFSDNGKKIWNINEKEAWIIRKIFSWYNQGVPYQEISERMIRTGKKSKHGGELSPTAIRRILRHSEYLGMTHNTRGELVPSKQYPAVLEPNFKIVLQHQELKRERVEKHFREAKTELAGLIRCRKCNAPYYTNTTRAYSGKKKSEIVRSYYAHLCDTPSRKACENKPKYIDRGVMESFVSLSFLASQGNRLDPQVQIENEEKPNNAPSPDSISKENNTSKSVEGQERDRFHARRDIYCNAIDVLSIEDGQVYLRFTTGHEYNYLI
jgi:site-specific DNA recombinase